MKRVAKIILLLSMLFVFNVNGFGRSSDVSYLFPPNEYMQKVGKKALEIDSFIITHQQEIQIDTIEWNVEFKVGGVTFLVRNTCLFDENSNIEQVRVRVIVHSYQNEILRIGIFRMDCPWDNTSDFGSKLKLYFYNGELILSRYFCNELNITTQLCGAFHSEFRNYFKNNKHYNVVVIDRNSWCGCGFNYILSSQSLNEIKEHLRENGIIN